MNTELLENYNFIRTGGTGFYQQKRGLIAVSGKEAVNFLNGMITNDIAKLEDGAQMLAAFPNAQGRLLAVVRVLRRGESFLFETEQATYQELEQNLIRWTFAGDFFVDYEYQYDYEYFEIINPKFEVQIPNSFVFNSATSQGVFVSEESVEEFRKSLSEAVEISDELYEILRIEQGIPLYGVDMDETTIVPELGLPELISYNKGCYIGQEIIARIHFRGHIAKQLTGLILSEPTDGLIGQELKSPEGKNAGKITSAIFSPKLEKTIALAYVRYEFLAEGTEFKINDLTATVKNLPFFEN